MTQEQLGKPEDSATGSVSEDEQIQAQQETQTPPREIGGPRGLEPTRYGDWEKNGRCSDF